MPKTYSLFLTTKRPSWSSLGGLGVACLQYWRRPLPCPHHPIASCHWFPNMADTRPPEKDHQRRASSGSFSKAEVEHQSRGPSVDQAAGPEDPDQRQRHDASARMENPLGGFSREQVVRMADEFCAKHGFTDDEDLRVFRLGAAIAGNDFRWDTIDGLRDDEKEALWIEVDHKWRANPKKLYGVIVVCVSLFTSLIPYIHSTILIDSRHFVLLYKAWTRQVSTSLLFFTISHPLILGPCPKSHHVRPHSRLLTRNSCKRSSVLL